MAIMTGEARTLDLALIIRDPEMQPREELNEDTLVQYSEDMLAGIKFPAVVVYHDRKEGLYWLSQGFHRCGAAEAAGFDSIFAEVREGTRKDALWDAAGSNREHDQSGLRRSNADKRRAVLMAMEAKPDFSDRGIAKQVGVGKTLVLNLRQVVFKTTSFDRRIGIDGKSYPTKNGHTGIVQAGSISQNSSSSNPEDDESDEEETHACHHCGITIIPRSRTYCESCLRSSDDTTLDQVLSDEHEPEPDEVFQLTPQNISSEVKPTSRPTFNATNEMVDWARWTWNPVTGCEHTCIYCYARDIANRFFPEKFTPTFHPERLEAPRNTNRPRMAEDVADSVLAMSWKNVFVCSMADLFGRWVPDQWIDDVFASCRKSPEWNYLFLTKFPQRYVGLDFPETAWVGTTVDEQKRVANAEKAFAKIKVPVKWLSVEPMREPIVFRDLSMFDWVVIGGQSRSSEAPEFHPESWWVIDLAYKARAAGCKVYLKPNTFVSYGWQIKEYPY
jgi:protein gp37